MASGVRVSIGLPVFNGENYLSESIVSVLRQTYKDFELIICDNSSTDRTAEICQRYASEDSRVRYYRNPRNLGASPNYNRTFDLSSGEYFKWMAHDDVIVPEYLERCVAALDHEPDAVLAQPLVGVIDARGDILSIHDNDLQRASSPRVSERFAHLVKLPRHNWEVFGLIRREVLARTALHAPYSWSDVALTVELALQGRFTLVPEPLFFNRDHAERFSHAVLVDREKCWQWWCNTGQAAGFAQLCPTWQLQADYARVIRLHAPGRGTRLRLYLRLLRHVFERYTLSRLVIEPITAVDPRVLAAGRRIKRLLRSRKAPGLNAMEAGVGPEARK